MSPSNLLIAGLNFTRAESFGAGLYRFAADRSLALTGVESLPEKWWEHILQWLSRPGKEPSVHPKAVAYN